jgi:hypothetical protein
MNYEMNNLKFNEYLSIIQNIRNNKPISENKIQDNINGEIIYKQYNVNIDKNIDGRVMFLKKKPVPIPNIFDELGKYLTSIISRTENVSLLYKLFAKKTNQEIINKYNKNDYVVYVKGSLVFRNKLIKLLPLIKNPKLVDIIKNVICLERDKCLNSVLRESDFDVNLIVFNNNPIFKQKIKNSIIKILIELKDELDTNDIYLKWINNINNTVQEAILNSLQHNKTQDKNKDNNSVDDIIEKKLDNYEVSEFTHTSIEQLGGKRKAKQKSKTKSKTNNRRSKINKIYKRISNRGTTFELMKNPRLRFVPYERAIELFKTIDQTRKSFYINNIKNKDYTFQTDIINPHHLDKTLPNKYLKTTQTFVSMNENIDMTLEKDNFNRRIHFDLYRLKLNLSFYMKYIGSNEFMRNIGGELIDVSFPYLDNAYINKNKNYYNEKLMKSQEYIGLDEYNMWGILIDLIETIEIESIHISKPHKFEKRVNRFILLRFIEYWFRIPFRIYHTLNHRSYYVYNSSIKRHGQTFNQFFRQTLHLDYEFNRIKTCLEKNQKIDIYRLYRKFLRIEPYQTLFKMSRSDLDDALGITNDEINHLPSLINNHIDLYKLFFDVNLSLVK